MGVFYTSGYASASPYPMTHSRILYDPIDGTVTASTEAEGFAAVNAKSPRTDTFWRPTDNPSSWEIDFGTTVPIDAVGIAAHDLAGQSVAVDTWNGAAWVEALAILPEDASPIMILFAQVATQKVRIRGDGILAAIGVIYAGVAMVMPVKAFGGLGQVNLKRQTEFKNNITEGGQWVGRSIARVALAASYSWEYLTDAWYLSTGDLFSRKAREVPFFLAARPLDYPLETAYAWVSADIQPERMGVRDFVRLGFEINGYTRA